MKQAWKKLASPSPGTVAAVAVGLSAAMLAATLTSCASPSPQAIARQKARASARLAFREKTAAKKRLAVAADGGGHVLRLGLMPQLADAAGLAGVRLGYFQQQLGVTVRLQVVSFTSATAEGAALAAGRLDVAYVDPVTAVRVWLTSGRKLIKVLAGAAARSARARPGTTSALFVVTTQLLATSPALADAMLKGQIQAEQVLGTDPARALGPIGAELTLLGARGVKDKQLARALSRVSYSNDPVVSSVLAQASRAAALGRIQPLPPSMVGLFDLGPVNKLLRAAGQPTVPG